MYGSLFTCSTGAVPHEPRHWTSASENTPSAVQLAGADVEPASRARTSSRAPAEAAREVRAHLDVAAARPARAWNIE